MRRIFVILIFVAIFAVVVIVPIGFDVWLIRTHSWDAAWFGLYMTAAYWLLCATLPALLKQWQLRSPSDPLSLDSAVLRRNIEGSFARKLRFYAVLVAQSLVESLVWPVFAYAMAYGKIRRQIFSEKVGTIAFLANLSLNTLLPLVSLFTTAATLLACIGLFGGRARLQLVHVFMLMMVGTVMLRHLMHLASPESVAMSLRRALRDPRLSFAALAIGDVVTLLIAFSAAQAAIDVKVLDTAAIAGTANEMFTFAKVRDGIMTGKPLVAMDYMIAIAGALYIAMGFKSVFSRGDLTRTAEDLQSIAWRQLLIGRHREARRWLDKVQTASLATHKLYAAIYLAAGDPEKAGHYAQRAVVLENVEENRVPIETVRTLILVSASVPMSNELRTNYVSGWLKLEHNDIFLQSCVEANIRKGWLGPQELLTLFDTPWVKKSHSLTYSSVLFFANEPELALNALDEKENPAPADEAVAILMTARILWIKFVNDLTDVNRDAFNAWIQEKNDLLAALCKKLESDYERLLLIEYLDLVADLVLERSLEGHDAYEQLARELRDELGGGDEVRDALSTIDANRIARKRALADTRFRESVAA